MTDSTLGAKPGTPDNSALYAIAVAVLLGAVLISASVYFGVGGLGDVIIKNPVSNSTVVVPVNNSNNNPAPNTTVVALPRTHGPDTTASITIGGSTFTRPYLGPANAKVTIVEFSDFQCPYCQMAYPTVSQFMQYYSGQVKLVFMEFPLTSIHPYAEKAAEAAECAGDQGAFWDYYEQSFTAKTLTVDDLKARAAGLGLDTAKFNTCLDSGAKATLVSSLENAGVNVGVQGTPAFLIGGNLTSGALPFDNYTDQSGATQPGFQALIAAALAKAG